MQNRMTMTVMVNIIKQLTKHHVKSLLYKSLVDAHELCHESLEMEYGFAA